jgi:integrase
VVKYVKNRQGKSAFERARNLCLIALLLLAGLRRGEALTLKLADCNLERRTLTLRNAKGINGGRTRTAYLSPELAEILLQYIEMRSNLQPPRTHPELLTLADEDRALTVPVVARIFKRMQRDLGFKVTPHMLRHTYALLLRQSGVPDRVSMDFLGHRSLAMLQRYSHVFEPEYRAESEKVILDIDGDLGPATPPRRI